MKHRAGIGYHDQDERRQCLKGNEVGSNSVGEEVTYKRLNLTRREKEVTQIERELIRINPVGLELKITCELMIFYIMRLIDD